MQSRTGRKGRDGGGRQVSKVPILAKMILRFTPIAPAVDAVDDAKSLMVKDVRHLLSDTERSLTAVSGVFDDVDQGEQWAAQAQLLEMLEQADFSELLSWAIEGSSALESWLLDSRRVYMPAFLGEAENYFRDLLSVFCDHAYRAAFDPKRTDVHTRWAVERHGSRLRQLDAQLTDLFDEIEGIKARLQTSMADTILDPEWAAITQFQTQIADRVRADVLPENDRLAELAGVVGGVAFPLVVLGEGGFGKSVLAGQLVRKARASNDAVLLVQCSRVGAADELGSVDAIDIALGRAASGLDRSIPLSRWISERPDAAERPLVIVDTLDLLLREDTADFIQTLLIRLSLQARLALTCRDAEWRELITDHQLLGWPAWTMPLLASEQIVQWARKFTREAAIEATRASEFLDSLELSLSRERGRPVFGAPLRLAMTCDLYAATGALPEHLTVSDLYHDYWQRRVARDRRGRRSTKAAEQERVADELAASIWIHSKTRFVEYVPPPSILTEEPRRSLQSEGIVQPLGGRWAFFHQTFAEFAVARHLATHATEHDLSTLETGLRESRSGYWGVAGHLTQQPVDTNRYLELTTAIPMDRVEGMRLRLQSACNQKDRAVLTDLALKAANEHPDVFGACSDALTGSPDDSAEQLTLVTLRLLGSVTSGLTGVVRTISELLMRTPQAARTGLFVQAVELPARRTPQLGSGVTRAEAPRLVEATVARQPSDFRVEGLLEAYRLLPPPGQAALLRALVARRLRSDEWTNVLNVLLARPYPVDEFESGASLLLNAYSDETTREAMGWLSWRSFLTLRYQNRWDGCQVRTTAELAKRPELLSSLLDALLSEEETRDTDRLVNTALFVADRSPTEVTGSLLARPLPTGRQPAAAFAQLARQATYPNQLPAEPLGDDRERELINQLRQIAPVNATKVWPPLLAIAARYPAIFKQSLAELAESNRRGLAAPATRRAAVSSLYSYATPALVGDSESIVRALLVGLSATTSAEFDGWMAKTSPIARSRVQQVFADKSARAAANAAAKQIKEWLGVDHSATGSDTVAWAATLLDTPHGHALRLILEALTQRLGETPPIEGLPERLVDRLQSALTNHDDGQVVEWLVNALTMLLRRRPPTAAQKSAVLQLFPVFREELKRGIDGNETHWAPAVYSQWASAIITLGAPCTSDDEVINLVLDMLQSTNLDHIGNRASRALATLLIRTGRLHPLGWPRIEQLWPNTTDGVRAAMIEALLAEPFPGAHTHAENLARDPKCPPASANHVLRRMDSQQANS